MIIKVTGTITTQGALRQGVSQSSGMPWATQSFMVKDEHDKEICFEAFGMENISKFQVGQSISIDCTVTGREYNGRLYNDVRYLAPKQEAIPTNQPQPQVQQVQQPQQAPQTQSYFVQQPQPQPQPQQTFQGTNGNNSGDLPF
jgi:hypothetical protein